MVRSFALGPTWNHRAAAFRLEAPAQSWRPRARLQSSPFPSYREAACPARESSVLGCPRWTRSIACRRFRRRRPKSSPRDSLNAAAAWRPTRALPWRASAARPIIGGASADALGDRILAELAADGVDVSSVRRIAGCVSPSAAILVDDQGERLVCAYNDPALDSDASWLPLDTLAQCHAVFADVRWPEGAAAVFAAAAVTASDRLRRRCRAPRRTARSGPARDLRRVLAAGVDACDRIRPAGAGSGGDRRLRPRRRRGHAGCRRVSLARGWRRAPDAAPPR